MTENLIDAAAWLPLLGASEAAAWLSAIGTVVAAGAAVAAVWVAYSQLSKLAQTLKMNALTVVLQLESEMNSRKQRCDEVAAQIEQESIKENQNEELIRIRGNELNGYLENWLNSADRLAFCILKGYLEERDWKAEYREYFADLVKVHKDKFGPDTIYTNIIDLHDRWKREA